MFRFIIAAAFLVFISVLMLIINVLFVLDGRKVPVDTNRAWKHGIMDADRRGIARTVVIDDRRLAVFRRGVDEQRVAFADIENVEIATIAGRVRTRPVHGIRLSTVDGRAGQFYFPSRWNPWGLDKGATDDMVRRLNARRYG